MNRSLHYSMAAGCLLGAALLAWLGWPRPRVHDQGNHNITICLRYDDYANGGPESLERDLVQLVKSLQGRMTMAAIPFSRNADAAGGVAPLSPERSALLRQWRDEGTVHVALHGYLHERPGSGNSVGEFDGLDAAEQKRHLTEGKRQLESSLGGTVDTFVPPWNAYDRTTLQLLPELGFKTLSALKEGAIRRRSPLRYVPYTVYPQHFQQALGAARRIPASDRVVLVLLIHRYDFKEADPVQGITTFPEFAALLRDAVIQGARLTALDDLGEGFSDVGPISAHLNGRELLATPPWVAHPRSLMLSKRDALALFYQALLLYLALALAAACVAILLHGWIADWPGGIFGSGFVVFFAVLAPVATWLTFEDSSPGYHSAVLFCLSVGGLLGGACSALNRRFLARS